jgi:hypothetical protein
LRVFGFQSLSDLPETEAMLPDVTNSEQLSISMAEVERTESTDDDEE